MGGATKNMAKSNKFTSVKTCGAEPRPYSRQNPVPLNTFQRYTYNSEYSPEKGYSLSVKVIEVVRGEQAYKDLLEQNKYYDEPESGYEYLNAKIGVSFLETNSDFSVIPNEYDFSTYTSNNEECPRSPYTLEPYLHKSIYAGGNSEGWITVLVKKGDEKPKMAYKLNYDGTGGIWFAQYK